MEPDDGRMRVAVLGSGGGAMAAAFALTATPELRARYQVTVYQEGWRIGGKGASGRNPDRGWRIEEHGLHLFFGFYDNVFALLRAVYAEWQPPPGCPIRTLDDAFMAVERVSLTHERTDGQWDIWNLPVPHAPGTPRAPASHLSVAALVARAVAWMHALIDELARHHAHHRPSLLGWLGRLVRGRHPALDELGALLGAAGGALEGEALDTVLRLLDDVEGWVTREVAEELERLAIVDAVVTALRLAVPFLRGVLRDVLPYGHAGFDRINDVDFKDWLVRHGADDAIAWCPYVRAYYDLAFGYVDGVRDRAHAQGAAGAAAKTLLLMLFGFEQSFLYTMRAGMGDTVFTPLFQVLRARGVRFELFHRVHALHPAPGGALVERIELQVQARTAPGPDGTRPPYQPLVTVKGLPCWPNQPRWDQLENGGALRDAGVNFESAWCETHVATRTLELGRDFDWVVCGISVEALKRIAAPLCAANVRFGTMVSNGTTVVTQAAQLWLNVAIDAVSEVTGPGALSAFVPAFTSWGEMSHLLRAEDWPSEAPPRAIEYFCGTMQEPSSLPPPDDHGYPARQAGRVFEHVCRWSGDHLGVLWPGAIDPATGAFRWDLVTDDLGRVGPERVAFQYWRANVDPTERYVQSLPGSIAHRLAPGDSGFFNLALAGDWTLSRVNGGCFEAAVESGLRAAFAVTGTAPIPIVGGDLD